jgi:dihydrofolate synthase / folylpolyglutamate synthase
MSFSMNDNLTSKKAGCEYLASLSKLLQKPTNPKLGLARTVDLLRVIGCNQTSMRIIQVVGTNGKGSTVAFIESVLQAHGIVSGLFTSPHLSSARERIRINGLMVSEADFVEASAVVLKQSQQLSEEPSFFECMLAMALWLFKKHGVQVAILEAGLGGRLDATTATNPDILGISMIDLDHQHILGDTIQQIAAEKIAAARPHQTVVVAQQIDEVSEVIKEAAEAHNLKLILAHPCLLPLGLYGEHQQHNAGLALELVKQLGIALIPQKVAQGLRTVNWPGRFEIILHDQATTVLDGAHNPSGMLSLVNCLKAHPQFHERPLILVYGSLAGQNAEKKVEILINAGLDIRGVFLHQPQNPRALTCHALRTIFEAAGFAQKLIHEFHNWQEIEQCRNIESAAILVCGSLYTVGEIRALLLSIDMDEKMPNF